MYLTNFTTEVAKRPYYKMLFCNYLKQQSLLKLCSLTLHSIDFTFNLGGKLNEDAKDQDSALLQAVRNRNFKQVEQLLADGVSPNVNSGRTPLHYAAYLDDVKIMKLLLDRGAKVNEVDNYGNTALHIAVQEKSKEVIPLLLQHDADVDIQNTFGRTPLHQTQKVEMQEVITLLEQKSKFLKESQQ